MPITLTQEEVAKLREKVIARNQAEAAREARRLEQEREQKIEREVEREIEQEKLRRLPPATPSWRPRFKNIHVPNPFIQQCGQELNGPRSSAYNMTNYVYYCPACKQEVHGSEVHMVETK